MTFFVFSVLPAPDSPVHKMDWSSRSTKYKTVFLLFFFLSNIQTFFPLSFVAVSSSIFSMVHNKVSKTCVIANNYLVTSNGRPCRWWRKRGVVPRVFLYPYTFPLFFPYKSAIFCKDLPRRRTVRNTSEINNNIKFDWLFSRYYNIDILISIFYYCKGSWQKKEYFNLGVKEKRNRCRDLDVYFRVKRYKFQVLLIFW